MTLWDTWMSPPVFDDAELTRNARTLHWLASRGTLIVAVLMAVAVAVSPDRARALITTGTALALFLAVWILVKARAVRLATVALPVAIYLLTAVSLVSYGLRSTHTSGFVFATLGHIPDVGETFEYQGVRFTVTEAERTRVVRVEVRLPESSSVSVEPSNASES